MIVQPATLDHTNVTAPAKGGASASAMADTELHALTRKEIR
jgi:hypothetical protein